MFQEHPEISKMLLPKIQDGKQVWYSESQTHKNIEGANKAVK